MFRYLLNFSYIGTAFRGIQRVLRRSEVEQKLTDIHSVQGVIELALQRLKPSNDINTIISSRTDAGVHALNTTLHIDLERQDGKAYNPFYITTSLNHTFFRYEIPIRVNSCYLIPKDLAFHCRFSAIGRTYLYRVAILKSDKETEETGDKVCHFIPIEETDRCFFLQKANFDFDAVKKVSKLFEGRHDFRTFMSLNPNTREKHCMYSIRTLHSVSIKEGISQASAFNRQLAEEHYNYYDIFITGRSFLYRQVRRMVGVLIAVGQGKLSYKDVYEMITIPATHNWPTKVQVMPPSGLYLCQVHYKPEEIEEIQRYNESFRSIESKKREIEAL